jgi:DNA-binding transcriptional LysR family regulator
MDRFESMSAFVAVTKAGGFSAASRQIGLPLPTVSRHVAELEAHLGVRLFHRSTRQVVLTEAGQNFYVVCQRLLEDLKDAEAVVSNEYRAPKGNLTVTAPMGFGRLHLQPVATEFLAAYPEINLRLMLADRVVDLVDEHVDLALRITALADSTMIARTLGHVRMVVTASPQYLAKRGIPTHPSELIDHDCIAWSALGPREVWVFDKGGVDVPYPIRPRLTTNSAESAIAAAVAGLGLAQTTCYQAEQGVREGKLKILMESFECARTPISLVHASHRLLPLKLRAFIDFAAPRLSERIHEVSLTMHSGALAPLQAAGKALKRSARRKAA